MRLIQSLIFYILLLYNFSSFAAFNKPNDIILDFKDCVDIEAYTPKKSHPCHQKNAMAFLSKERINFLATQKNAVSPEAKYNRNVIFYLAIETALKKYAIEENVSAPKASCCDQMTNYYSNVLRKIEFRFMHNEIGSAIVENKYSQALSTLLPTNKKSSSKED